MNNKQTENLWINNLPIKFWAFLDINCLACILFLHEFTALIVEAPSVTLYAFQLRNDITHQVGQRLRENADELWNQCVALGNDYKISVLQSLYEHLRCYTYNINNKRYEYNPDNENQEATLDEKLYLDNFLELVRTTPKENQARSLSFHSLVAQEGLSLMGDIYPIRIHDTYAVDLTLRYRETVEISQIKALNPTDYIKASLGQSLLFFATPIVQNISIQNFANQCAAALLHKEVDGINPSSVGQLFGSLIFEYENYKQNVAELDHTLVWLNSHPETVSRIAQRDAYDALLTLLCFRHKIIFAYHQSRLCEEAAQKLYDELEGQVNVLAVSSQQTLEVLKQWLKQMPLKMLQYKKWLRDIQDHQSAIITNVKNYHSQLEKLNELSFKEDDLNFFYKFINITCKQFQEQIYVDLRYLIPAQDLFQEMIATIRGIVEIEAEEQAEFIEERDKIRERNLQIYVGAVGGGIGVAGVVASSFQYLIKPEPENKNILLQPPFISDSIHPFGLVIIVSLFCGLASAGLPILISMLCSSHRNKRRLYGYKSQKANNAINLKN